MIDLRNTWIKRSVAVDNIMILRYRLIPCSNEFYYFDEISRPHLAYYNSDKTGKQIHLIDGEFQYVTDVEETKPECMFARYSFEVPDFECEILKVRINRKKENCYIGYFVGKNGDAYPCEWTPSGRICKTSIPEHKRRPWDLTLIKKEWYENPDNFPCLIVSSQHNEMSRALRFEDSKIITDGTFRYSPNDVRLATKEELLSLYVEEITMSHTETN